MAVSNEKFRDRTYLIILFSFIGLSNFCIIVFPFAHSEITDIEGVTWRTDVWFAGFWHKYDRLATENTDEGGGWWTLNDYRIEIMILVLTGILIIFGSIFFTGRNRWRSFKVQRIGGAFMLIGSILGFIGIMLFIRFLHNQSFDPLLKLHYGFYYAAVYFPLIMLASIYAMIKSVQLPIPEKKPAPPQEGILMSEDKKDAKRRKFFESIDDINEEADRYY